MIVVIKTSDLLYANLPDLNEKKRESSVFLKNAPSCAFKDGSTGILADGNGIYTIYIEYAPGTLLTEKQYGLFFGYSLVNKPQNIFDEILLNFIFLLFKFKP
jgi:hypothetical protein